MNFFWKVKSAERRSLKEQRGQKAVATMRCLVKKVKKKILKKYVDNHIFFLNSPRVEFLFQRILMEKLSQCKRQTGVRPEAA